MTLFQTVAMWSLRALVLWGALEAGASVFQEAQAELTEFDQIQSQQPALTALTQRTRASQSSMRDADATLAFLKRQAWALPAAANSETPAALAAQSLREILLSLGAEAPVVDPGDAGVSNGLGHVTMTARWREPAQSAPAILPGLSTQIPGLRLTALHLHNDISSNAVVVEATFYAPIRIGAAP